jgi:hypothetical protein
MQQLKEQAQLEDFEVFEEVKRELTAKQKFALNLLRHHEHWDEMENPLIVMEKAKINAYIKKLGVENCGWAIGYGIFLCTFCRKDGIKHKLQKVNHIGSVCKECALKYQTEIRDLLNSINTMMKWNGLK